MKSLDYDLLGKIYREEGNYTEALKMLDIAIAKSKENWEIDWYNDLKKKLKH